MAVMSIPSIANAANRIDWRIHDPGSADNPNQSFTIQLVIEDPSPATPPELTWTHPYLGTANSLDFGSGGQGRTHTLPTSCGSTTVYPFLGYNVPPFSFITGDTLTITCDAIPATGTPTGTPYIRYTLTVDRPQSNALSENGMESWRIDVGLADVTLGCITNDGANDAYFWTADGESGVGKNCSPEIGGLDSVAAALVLDISGSMNAVPTGWGSPKITALRQAVNDMLVVWQRRRGAFGDGGFDHVALRYFNGTAQAPAVGGTGFARITPNVSSTIDSAANPAMFAWVQNFPTATGSTSIGAGIASALAQFGSTPAGVDRRTLVVMSDGQQNTYPMVDCSTTPCRLDDGAGGYTPITGIDRISAITIGTGGTVDEAINQALADSTGGIYLGSDLVTDDPNDGLMRLYFLSILEDYLQFDTVQATRIGREYVEYSSNFSDTFRLGSSGTNANLVVMGPAGIDIFVTLVDPNGNQMSYEGTERISAELPQVPGEWQMYVNRYDSDEFPIWSVNYAVYEDDDTVHGNLGVVAEQTEPGEDIVIEARPTGAEDAPITGLLTRGGRAEVAVTVPTGSVGDLLAAFGELPGGPGNQAGDPRAAVVAALEAALQSEHAPLRTTFTLPMVEEQPGVYRAVIPAGPPGIYEFDIQLEGTDAVGLEFARERIITRHVRAIPDPDASEITATTSVDGGINYTTLTVRPRTVGGHLLGPGFRNYMVIDVNGRRLQFNAERADGSYVAYLSGLDAVAPLSWGFVEDLKVVTDQDWRSGAIQDLQVREIAGGVFTDGRYEWWRCTVGSDAPGETAAFLGLVVAAIGVSRRRRRRSR